MACRSVTCSSMCSADTPKFPSTSSRRTVTAAPHVSLPATWPQRTTSSAATASASSHTSSATTMTKASRPAPGGSIGDLVSVRAARRLAGLPTREAGRVRHRRSYRSSARSLRALARWHLYFSLDRTRQARLPKTTALLERATHALQRFSLAGCRRSPSRGGGRRRQVARRQAIRYKTFAHPCGLGRHHPCAAEHWTLVAA